MTTGSSDVVVVGAGLAGLAAAQLCRRRGLVVTVFDQHPGGRARSDRKDGFVFNRGPHAIYRGGATERVLRELGVTYSGGPPALASGAILVDGRQFAMPATKSAVLTSRYFATRDKVTYGRFFTRLARMDAAQFGGVTVSEMLGDLTDRAAKVALMAVRTATYAHAPDVMSAEVAITALQAPGVLYIDDGWQHLVDSLAEGIDVRSESVVTINGGVVTTGVGTYEAPMAIPPSTRRIEKNSADLS